MIENRVYGTEIEWGLLAASPNVSVTYPDVLQDHILSQLMASYIAHTQCGDGRSPLYVRNTYLSNGDRLYPDHQHPEYSTSEVTSIADLIAKEWGSEKTLLEMCEYGRRVGIIGQFILNKRVSDHLGNTWGAHENYQVDRRVLDPRQYRRAHADAFHTLGLHLATRNVIVGSGGIYRRDFLGHDYALGQKTMDLQTDFGVQTTQNKPLVNLRDKAHADEEKFARLHVTSGDTNILPRPTALRIGSTLIVLALIEEGMLLGDEFRVEDDGLHRFARHTATDLTCKVPFVRADGRTILATDVQYELASRGDKLNDQGMLSPELVKVLEDWKLDIGDLSGESGDPMNLKNRAEWVMRMRMLQSQIAKLDGVPDRLGRTDWSHQVIKARDLMFDGIDSKGSLADKLRGLSTMADWAPDPDRVEELRFNPVEDTRAYDRGRLVTRLAKTQAEGRVDWDKVALYNVGLTIDFPDPRIAGASIVDRVLDGWWTRRGLPSAS